MNNNNNESEVVSRLRNGDEGAFISLFNSYKDKLYSFVLSLTHSEDDASDVVQNVFLKLWQNKSSLPLIDNVNAYLFTIAQHDVLDGLRKYARYKLFCSQLDDNEEEHGAHTPYDDLLSGEIRDKYKEAVNHLTPQQQKIFLMHYEQGMTHAEIAKELNLSVSTVQNHSFRAIESIRKYLSSYYPCILLLIISGVL